MFAKSIVIYIASLLFLLCFNSSGCAETVAQTQVNPQVKPGARFYQVDLIVFKHVAANYLNPEQAYNLLTSIEKPGDIKLAPINLSPNIAINIDTKSLPIPISPNILNQLLPVNNFFKNSSNLSSVSIFHLANAQQQLTNSSAYKILYSTSWISDFYYGKSKVFVWQAGPNYVWPNATSYSNDQTEIDIAQVIDNNNINLSHPALPKLQGRIAFNLNHYFDIKFFLQIIEPQGNQKQLINLYPELTETFFVPFRVYHIEQSIRTRSKKLIYLDNPNYGVLLFLTPIDSDDYGQLVTQYQAYLARQQATINKGEK